MDTLETHWKTVCLIDQRDLAVAALLAGCCERGSTDPASPAVTADAAAIMRAACMVAINGAAAVPLCVTGSADRTALCLYPLISLFNHSCRPNVSLTFRVRSVSLGVDAMVKTGPGLHELFQWSWSFVNMRFFPVLQQSLPMMHGAICSLGCAMLQLTSQA